MKHEISINKQEAELHLIYAVVFQPDTVDAHNDFMTKDSVRELAHDFLVNGRMFKVDIEHDRVESGATVVESFIARDNDPDFVVGSWVVCIHIPDDDSWEYVKSGEINGLSMSIVALATEQEIEMEVPDKITGMTSNKLDHEHKYTVYFDEDGKFLGGKTNKVNGHSHKIVAGTITETEHFHNHTYTYMEHLNNVKKL